MIAFDLSVTGISEVERQLEQLSATIQKRIVRKALRAGAKPILAMAKQKVPVKTGRLRRSLKVRALRRSRRRIGVEVRAGTREELGIPASCPWYYPAIVEYGQRGVPAKSYLRSSKHAKAREAERIIKQTIRQGIETEAKKMR